VLSNAIRVLEPGRLHKFEACLTTENSFHVADGTEQKIIKDMEGNNQQPKIKYCSICDPFFFILLEDDIIVLFIGEPEHGKIRHKDMSPMDHNNYCIKIEARHRTQLLMHCFFKYGEWQMELSDSWTTVCRTYTLFPALTYI
jgi:hypothetical protein